VKRIAIAIAVCVGLAIGVGSARAQSPAAVEKAKKYFESGKQAYTAGQYRVAAAAFEEAFRLVPRPAILFSAAQAYRRQYFVDRKPRDLKRAVELFKLYVEKVPKGGRRNHAVEHLSNLEPLWERIKATLPKDDASTAAPTQLLVSSSTPGAKAMIDGKRSAKIPVTWDVKPGQHSVQVQAPGYFSRTVKEPAVEGRLIVVRVELQPKPAVFKVKAPSGSTIAINGRTYGTAPLPRDIRVPAGSHYITVSQRGHKPFARELELKRGQVADLDVKLRKTRQRKAAYWVGGTAVVLLTGGVVAALFAGAEQKTARDIRANFTDGGTTNITEEQRIEYNDAVDARNRWRTATYGLFSVGAALAGTAALLWFVDNPAPRAPVEQRKTKVTPSVGPNSLGASVSGRF
jgi:hypothetical protein